MIVGNKLLSYRQSFTHLSIYHIIYPKQLEFSRQQSSFLNNDRVCMKWHKLDLTYDMRRHSALSGMIFVGIFLYNERHGVVTVILISLKAYTLDCIVLNKVYCKCCGF
jgi:hypothetical protein